MKTMAKNGLQRLRKDYSDGRITADEYVDKALKYRDGDHTMKRIMGQFSCGDSARRPGKTDKRD